MTSGSFPPPACSGFAGNSDFYGLGIRIGIYLQWISSLLTNVLLPRGISDSLDTNSIFLFAVFVAVANATSLSQEGFHLVEIFVMLQLCFGYLLSVLSVSGLRFTLFSDSNNTHPRFTLQNARDLLNDLPVDFRRLFDIPAIFNSNHPIEVLQSQMNGVRKVVPVLNFRVSPPPGVSISRLEELMLWGLNTLAIYSLLPEILSSDLSPTILSALEPFFWTIDFMVIFALHVNARADLNDLKKAFKRDRLQNYQRIRKLAMQSRNPQIFSLALTSSFKTIKLPGWVYSGVLAS